MGECFSCQKKIHILSRQGDKKFIIRNGYIPNEKMAESDKLCQSCLDEIKRTQTQVKTSDKKISEEKRRSGFWYLLPILFGIIGGVIAYFVIKQDDQKKAKNCLYLGIVLLIIDIVFGVSFL